MVPHATLPRDFETDSPVANSMQGRVILPSSAVQEQQALQFLGGLGQTLPRSFPPIPIDQPSDLHFPDASHQPAPVTEATFDPVYTGGQSLVFLQSNASFGPSGSDSGFTFLNPAQDGIVWPTPGSRCGLALVHADPSLNYVPQSNNDLTGYPMHPAFVPPPAPYTMNPGPNIPPLVQATAASLEVVDSFALSSVVSPYAHHDFGQSVAGLSVGYPSPPNPVGVTTGIHSSSYLEEYSQEVDAKAVLSSPCTAGPISERHLVLSETPAGHCGWQDGSGSTCKEVLTCANLSMHLAEHGIKKLTRDHRMKCNWAGCKRKKLLNRESIVRHIREVHLRLKRPPKKAQEPRPVFEALLRPPGQLLPTFPQISDDRGFY